MEVDNQTAKRGPYTLDDVLNADTEFSEDELNELLAENVYGVWDPIKEPLTPAYIEEAKRESIVCYSQIPMFDYGLGKESNYQAISDFYGSAIPRQIQEERRNNGGRISKKLWQKMKDIRTKKRPPEKYGFHKKQDHEPDEVKSEKKETDPVKPKPTKKPDLKIKRRERQPGDDYFMMIERGVILNEDYRERFKGPGTVYEWIWANIVRDQWKDTEAYPIKEKYFDKGYLVYCSTYGKIAKECGMSKNTVHSYIKLFEKDGVVKTRQYIPNGKKQGQTVFILGTWKMVNGDVVETYYRSSVYLTPKPVKK